MKVKVLKVKYEAIKFKLFANNYVCHVIFFTLSPNLFFVNLYCNYNRTYLEFYSIERHESVI